MRLRSCKLCVTLIRLLDHNRRCQHIRLQWVKAVSTSHILYTLQLNCAFQVSTASSQLRYVSCLKNRSRCRITCIQQMFEHMKNYKALMSKVTSWLRPEGPEESLFFVHIFCHRTTPYHFEEGDGWMAQTFFSGLYCCMRVQVHIELTAPGYRWDNAVA